MPMLAHATIADLERHPGRCELINGELIEMSPMGYDHGTVMGSVHVALAVWARGRPFRTLVGDVGFIWSPDTVRAPDVAIITTEQAENAPRRGFLPFAPVLAVEVVSPGDQYSEVHGKAEGWLAHGTALVWIVDPRRQTVEVCTPGMPVRTLHADDELTGGSALPDFACRVGELFVR